MITTTIACPIGTLALLLAACSPAKSPTATDLATTAIVLTDDALTIAIAVQPKGFDRTIWEDRVAWLERAAYAVENSRSICPYISSLHAIASGIKCAKCTLAIDAAKEQIKCP